MNEKYEAYLSVMQQRDTAMVSLAIMALAIIAAWELVPFVVPGERARRTLRKLFLIGGPLLYAATLIVLSTIQI